MLVASKHCGILAKFSDRWYYLSAFAINPRCPFSAKHDRRNSIITGDLERDGFCKPVLNVSIMCKDKAKRSERVA
jgi:hypothetical protein